MSKSRITILSILIFIVVLFLVLPAVVKFYINGPLNDKIACCTLSVQDVDIDYPLMQVELHRVKYFEKSGNNPEINATIDKGVARVKGFELTDFLLDLEVEIIEPQVFYFDDGKGTKDDEDSEDDQPFYLPIRLNSIQVKDGKVHFSHKAVEGKQAIDFHHVDIKVSNWSLRKADSQISKLYITSTVEENAKLTISGELIPFKIADTMNVDYSLENLDMTNINKVLLNYIPVDITRGKLAIYGELDRNEKQDQGYVKIFLEDFDIIKSEQEFLNVSHFAIEVGSAIANTILKNRITENAAFKIPFKKTDGEIDVDKSEAFFSGIENIFDSLERGVENKF